jgi:hypothetical protein
MNKSNILKKAGIGVAFVAVPALVSGQTTEGDSLKQTQLPEFTPSSFEYHIAPDGHHKGRINLFYELPLKTEAYSFMEFYGKGGYFGKTMLHTPITKKGTGFKTEVKHHSFGPVTAGIGFEQEGMLPGDVFASIKFLPVVFDRNGYVENQAILGYFASKVIPINRNLNINISSFLDFNIAGKNGPECDYGETDATLEIKTKHGQIDTGIGYNHNVTGKFAPDNQFRARIGYHPKK